MTAIMAAASPIALPNRFAMIAGEDGNDTGLRLSNPLTGESIFPSDYLGNEIRRIHFDDGGGDAEDSLINIEFLNHQPQNFFGSVHIVGPDWDLTLEPCALMDNGGAGRIDQSSTPDATRWRYDNQAETQAASGVFTAGEEYIITILPPVTSVHVVTSGSNGDNSGFTTSGSLGPFGSVDNNDMLGGTLVGFRFNDDTDLFSVVLLTTFLNTNQARQDAWTSMTVSGPSWSETFVAASADAWTASAGNSTRWDFDVPAHVKFTDAQNYTFTITHDTSS